MPTLKIQCDQSFKADVKSHQSIQRNYSVISYTDRIRLIEMVCIEKQQIIQAAPSLGIKISTAKYILSCFRKGGKILKKCQVKNKEDKRFLIEMQQLKRKVEQVSKRKKEEKEKKKYNENSKISNLNTKEKLSLSQLKKQEKYQQKNQTFELGVSKPQSVQESESNKIYFPVVFLAFYSPCWTDIPANTNIIP